MGDVSKGETMNKAKLILTGAAALAISMTAMEDSITDTSSTMYEVDEDRDGRSDRMLLLEQSDSLA
jgi:hypothetical protein